MKRLNKYMVNRIAGLLLKAFDGEWGQISDAFRVYIQLSSGWDKAVPDTKDFEVDFKEQPKPERYGYQ